MAKGRLAIRRHPLTFRLLVAFAAIGGMTASVLAGLDVRESAFAGSDMKTLFASAWCFAHGKDAYSMINIQSAFAANHVVFPQSWFAHAPVYPPTTLALLAPLTLISMVPAVYCVVIGSSILFAFAVAALMREAARGSRPIVSQVVVAVIAACCPLFSFAASMANVSIAACSLCLLAFLGRRRGYGWMCGAALAIAVLLKPHVAIWMLMGMLIMPERAARAVAIRAALLTCAFTVFVGIALNRGGHFALQFHGFDGILRSEMARGSSMSPNSHEVVPIVAQITALHSLPGFWWNDSSMQSVVVALVVLSLGTVIAWQLHKAYLESDLYPSIGAWLTFGLLATYHRAHDAMILLLLVPWLMEGLQRAPRKWYLWVTLSFGLMLNVAPTLATGNLLLVFLSLRQAALANLGLMLTFLGIVLVPRLSLSMRSARQEKTAPVFSAS